MPNIEEIRKEVEAEIGRLIPVFVDAKYEKLILLAIQAGGPLRVQLLPIMLANVVAAQSALAIQLSAIGNAIGIDMAQFNTNQLPVGEKLKGFMSKLSEEDKDATA